MKQTARTSLLLSKRASRLRRLASFTGRLSLLAVTFSSTVAVLFIFYFVAKDGLPFFWQCGLKQFFTSTEWYPSHEPPVFGALAIFVGSGLVTIGAVAVAVPLGVAAAVCLSDVLPFAVRQLVKPVIEVLAAIPSVVYGFFALIVLAPLLQDHGGRLLAIVSCAICLPAAALVVLVLSDTLSGLVVSGRSWLPRAALGVVLGAFACLAVFRLWGALDAIRVDSGMNALNGSLILGIMALPTVVSVSEDALQAVGRELREASYALGSTRAETIFRVVLPAASSGIAAAAILGIMRAIGETMVVLMATGNAAQIPEPLLNFLRPIKTITATIAGDMGEADQSVGSARYHVLFALALVLLAACFVLNLLSEWSLRRARRRMQGR